MTIGTSERYEAVHKGARFGLTLQEPQPYDIMTYGGFWGQAMAEKLR